jgi:hypothetical protein
MLSLLHFLPSPDKVSSCCVQHAAQAVRNSWARLCAGLATRLALARRSLSAVRPLPALPTGPASGVPSRAALAGVSHKERPCDRMGLAHQAGALGPGAVALREGMLSAAEPAPGNEHARAANPAQLPRGAV